MQHVLGMWAQLVAARREAEQQQCELATAQVSSLLHTPCCAATSQHSPADLVFFACPLRKADYNRPWRVRWCLWVTNSNQHAAGKIGDWHIKDPEQSPT